MPRTKTQKILRYVAYGGLGLGIIALLLYVFVIRTIQIHNQKQNFAKAEASLDSLEQQIETKIGKPDQIKKEKSCGYASRVYARGPRNCGLSIYSLYKNNDYATSTQIMLAAADVTGTPLYNSLGGKGDNRFIAYSGHGSSQEFSQSLDLQLPNIVCSITYDYPVVPLFDKEFTNLSSENLQISLSCGGSAMIEFYPVKN